MFTTRFSHLMATLLASMMIVLSFGSPGWSVSLSSKGCCSPSRKRCSPVTTTEDAAVKPHLSFALVGDESFLAKDGG